MRNSVINRVKEYALKDDSVFIITGDAGFGVLDDYQKIFPNRYLNMGIAEQNMISFAAGLALSGYKVFIYNIIPFLLYRSYEQVRNDICYQRIPITLIGIGSGVTYAPGGITHYAVEDIALARTLPNMVIMSPSDPVEAEKCTDYAYKSKKPTYIRIPKTGEPIIHKDKFKSITSPIIIGEGEEVAVLFHGSVSTDILEAANSLKKKPRLISVPMIQPLDLHNLKKNLKNIHTIMTVEEHFVEGGLGSVISEWIAKERLPLKLEKLGIKNGFIHLIKKAEGIRSHYGFSQAQIRNKIIKSFKNE